MERLVKPVSDGGVPYNNFNFYSFLQENHRESYSSILDEMNDIKERGNSGIILKGCKLVSSDGSNCEFNFLNSVIYLDGDFREPIPTMATSSFNINAQVFYLISGETKEERFFKVTDEGNEIVTNNYFKHTLDKPNDSDYIEIEVKDGVNITSRNFSRVMRYYNAEDYQIFMCKDKKFFNDEGEGFGEMLGFHLCNGKKGSQNLNGRYLVGYKQPFSSTSLIGWSEIVFPNGLTDSSQDINSDKTERLYEHKENYSYLKNVGGNEKVYIHPNHLPPHNHDGVTTIPNNHMRHSHEIHVNSNKELGEGKDQLVFSVDGLGFKKQGVGPFFPSLNVNGPTNQTFGEVFPPTNSYMGVVSKKINAYTSLDFLQDYQLISTMYSPERVFSLEEKVDKSVMEETNWQTLRNNTEWEHKGWFLGQTEWPMNNNQDLHLPIPGNWKANNRQTVSLENHTHSLDTFAFLESNLPNGSPHDNLPPYYVITYYQKIVST